MVEVARERVVVDRESVPPHAVESGLDAGDLRRRVAAEVEERRVQAQRGVIGGLRDAVIRAQDTMTTGEQDDDGDDAEDEVDGADDDEATHRCFFSKERGGASAQA